MRQMKDSGIAWVGEIPQDWRITKVKYCFSNVKEIVGGKVDNYERLSLTMNGVVKRSKEDNIGLQPDKFETYQILRPNELVFKLIDLQNVSTSRVGLSPYLGIVSPAYIILKCNNNIYPQFAEKYFLMMWKNHIFNAFGDAGVRSSLSSVDLLELPIVLPPFDEQQQIAEFIEKKCVEIDELIFLYEQQIEKLKEYNKSIITEAVTKGVNNLTSKLDGNGGGYELSHNIFAVPMKDSGIVWLGDTPVDWRLVPLYCLYSERKNINSLGKENNLLSLSYGKIIRKDVNSNEGLLPTNYNGYNIIEKNDIVIRPTDLQNDKRSLRTGLVKERGIITSAYIALKPKHGTNSKYYHYLLRSYDLEKVFYNMGNGVRQSLNYDEFSKLMVLVPPKAMQQIIVDYLDKKCTEIEQIIADKNTQLDTLDDYKKSLIYEYVTGKREAA